MWHRTPISIVTVSRPYITVIKGVLDMPVSSEQGNAENIWEWNKDHANNMSSAEKSFGLWVE